LNTIRSKLVVVSDDSDDDSIKTVGNSGALTSSTHTRVQSNTVDVSKMFKQQQRALKRGVDIASIPDHKLTFSLLFPTSTSSDDGLASSHSNHINHAHSAHKFNKVFDTDKHTESTSAQPRQKKVSKFTMDDDFSDDDYQPRYQSKNPLSENNHVENAQSKGMQSKDHNIVKQKQQDEVFTRPKLAQLKRPKNFSPFSLPPQIIISKTQRSVSPQPHTAAASSNTSSAERTDINDITY
jgi:hypothetical protein